MIGIRPCSGWQTSDGEFFVDEVTAQLHQNDLNFRNWCRENVCVGGEWDARMVASAILEHWNVSSKHPTAPESASGTQYGTSGTPGQVERISTKEPAPGRTDAERFEWLCNSMWYVGPGNFYCDGAGRMQNYDDKNSSVGELRAAIDKEMNEKAEPPTVVCIVPETVYRVPPSIGDRFEDEDDDQPF